MFSLYSVNVNFCYSLYIQSSMESVITTLDPGMKEVISKFACTFFFFFDYLLNFFIIYAQISSISCIDDNPFCFKPHIVCSLYNDSKLFCNYGRTSQLYLLFAWWERNSVVHNINKLIITHGVGFVLFCFSSRKL